MSIISIAILSFVMLIDHVSGACRLSTQLDGLCTACPPQFTLTAGFCIPSLKGCRNALSPNVCGTCLPQWTLSEGQCYQPGAVKRGAIPEASLYFDKAADLKYQLLDVYFKSKYKSQLSDKISNVSMCYTLKTTYGNIYTLTYSNPFSNGGSLYRAEAIVDRFNTIVQYRFLQITWPTINNYESLLWFMERKLLVQNLTTLRNFHLNQVQQLNNNDFRFFYINFEGAILVKDLQKTPSTGSLSFPSLTQLHYQINQNTVINYVFSLFPPLQTQSSYTANQYSILDSGGQAKCYYQFVFDSDVIVIVQVDGTQLHLYSYDQPDNVVSLPTSSAQPGRYMPFLNLDNSLFITALNAVKGKYSFLNNKNIQSVRYQIAAGTNFMIQFNNYPFSTDTYLAIVNYPLSGSVCQVSVLLKNGIDIGNTPIVSMPGSFNYETDSIFKKTYQYFRQAAQQKLKRLMPISSVQYVVNADQSIDYLVIFTTQEYAYLRYSLFPSPSPSILSYTVFDKNITLTPLHDDDPQRETLLTFLADKEPSLFSKFVIVSLQEEQNMENSGFCVDLLTPYGTYYVRAQHSCSLYISDIIQTSWNTCSDLDPQEYLQNPVISSLTTYLFNTYWQLSGFTLSLAQAYFSSSGDTSYRILFAKNNERYEALVKQVGTNYQINSLSSKEGTGCDRMFVKVGNACTQTCNNFVF